MVIGVQSAVWRDRGDEESGASKSSTSSLAKNFMNLVNGREHFMGLDMIDKKEKEEKKQENPMGHFKNSVSFYCIWP